MTDLVGLNYVKAFLEQKLKSNSLPNKLFFHGPIGTGKSTLAMRVAKNLACSSPINGEACNSCKTCISKSNIKVFNMGRERKATDIEEIIHNIFDLQASSFYNSIYIIEELQAVSWDNQVAFLTEFDRIQDKVYIIVCSTDEILPQLKSRCHTLEFSTPSMYECRELIQRMNPEIKTRVADIITERCRYIPRDIINIVNNSQISDDINGDILKYYGYMSDMMLEFLRLFLGSSDNFLLFIQDQQERGTLLNLISNLPSYMMSVLAYKAGNEKSIFSQGEKIRLGRVIKDIPNLTLFRAAGILARIKYNTKYPEIELLDKYQEFHSKESKINNPQKASENVIKQSVRTESKKKEESLANFKTLNKEDIKSLLNSGVSVSKTNLFGEPPS